MVSLIEIIMLIWKYLYALRPILWVNEQQHDQPNLNRYISAGNKIKFDAPVGYGVYFCSELITMPYSKKVLANVNY